MRVISNCFLVFLPPPRPRRMLEEDLGRHHYPVLDVDNSYMSNLSVGGHAIARTAPVSGAGTSGGSQLKRRASSALLDAESSRKKLKETAGNEETREHVDGDALSATLAAELQCGCCAALVYNPVIVNPCQHFFCGGCCVLWIKVLYCLFLTFCSVITQIVALSAG